MIPVELVRAAIDGALLEVALSPARGHHAWSGDSPGCIADGEGMYCCLDPDHVDYAGMLDDLAVRIAKRLNDGPSGMTEPSDFRKLDYPVYCESGVTPGRRQWCACVSSPEPCHECVRFCLEMADATDPAVNL